MNKTISINLGGSVFNIEEEAYQILKNYLDSIRANFSGDPASGEIMADIEARIAEIFHEYNSEKKNVVTKEDIEAMIAVMGSPEDYKMESDNEPSKKSTVENETRNPKRKIYRDTDDAVIAGVCSGISQYLGWDPLILRLLMVILTIISFGFPGILGYFIFYLVVPPARTTAEKLQMRGETVNVENIGKFVNEEAKSATDKMGRFSKSAAQSVRSHSSDFLKMFGRIFGVIFGLFILMIGLGLLAGLFALLVFSDFNFYGFDGTSWDSINTLMFANDGTLWVLVVGVILAMAAPAIALIYGAIKLITGSSKKIKGLAISLLSLFIIGILLCTYGGIKTGKQFSRDAEVAHSTLLPDMKSDTLYFDAIPDSVFIGHHGHYNDVNDLVKITPSAIYYGEPINIHFEPSASNQIKILVEKKSQGANREQAGIYARNIQYNFKTDTDMIIMDPFFSTPRNDLYRTQEVEVKIYVPIGKYVKFGENAHLVTWHSHEDGALKMTADGLENEDNVEIEMESDLLNDPQVRVTDDSVIIKTDEIEIKTRRD